MMKGKDWAGCVGLTFGNYLSQPCHVDRRVNHDEVGGTEQVREEKMQDEKSDLRKNGNETRADVCCASFENNF